MWCGRTKEGADYTAPDERREGIRGMDMPYCPCHCGSVQNGDYANKNTRAPNENACNGG